MRDTKANRLARLTERLANAGVPIPMVPELLRLERRLRRWHEMECGTDRGHIERDSEGRPSFVGQTGRSYRIRDSEKACLARLEQLLGKLTNPYYVQTDPRGCALYFVPVANITGPLETCYSRGIAVCV